MFFAVPPGIDSAPKDERVVKGDSRNWFCNATGNPRPNITWTKEGEISVLSTSETLELTKLGSEDNENVNDLNGRDYTYSCTATNDLGYDKRTASIKITSTFHHFDVIMKICIIVPSAHCC